MIVAPPVVPKDYHLKSVDGKYASGAEHTGLWIPRITQTTLKKYAYPLFPLKNEKPGIYQITPINERVLNKWTTDNRAWWVDKPGINGFYIDDMLKKYSVVVEPEFDARYKNKNGFFPRSYKYEIDCIEEKRLRKLHEKNLREKEEDEKKFGYLYNDNVPNKYEEKRPCKADCSKKVKKDYTSFRWQKQPDLLQNKKTDDCLRRWDMTQVGQLFKCEACNWYYLNYPPPDIIFRPEKFSQ